MTPLQITATGLAAQAHRVEVVANNLANMNTSGFQARRAEFSNLIFSDRDRPDTRESRALGETTGTVKIGFGVQIAGTFRVTEAGSLRETDGQLDLAIQGEGYFQVALPEGGTAFTRAGTFQLNPAGDIVTQDGMTLDPPVNVPPNITEIVVNPSGQILGNIQGQDGVANLGQLTIARFANDGGLRNLGNNLLQVSEASGPPIQSTPGDGGAGTIVQGFIEGSNVNPVQEIAKMIEAMRAYQINSQVVQVADQMAAPPPGG